MKCLSGVLVQRFVEPADELLENRAHRRVVDLVWMEVYAPEPLQHLEEESRFVEPADGVAEVEPLQHLPHVLAEARDVVTQVWGHVGGVRQQSLEVVLRGVVEREPRRTAELPVEVFESPAFQFRLSLEHVLPRRSQNTIEPAQHGQRQDDILVLSALEGVPDEVGNAPDEADYLAVVHSPITLPDLACERESHADASGSTSATGSVSAPVAQASTARLGAPPSGLP